MRIILISWKEAENDPFSFFNACLEKQLNVLGHEVFQVDCENNFFQHLSDLAANGVDFAITWQGIASKETLADKSQLIWEYLRIPLICLHGDHPSHCIENHRGNSKAIAHLYTTQSFTNYANSFITREHPAKTVIHANYMHGNVAAAERFEGDFFVLPKNIDDNAIALDWWEKRLPKPIYVAFRGVEQAITHVFRQGNKIDHHSIIEQFLTPELYVDLRIELNNRPDNVIHNLFHGVLDKLYRNMICEHILTELADVKLKIYGRGWDRFAAMNNKNHEFYPIDKLKDGNFQFHSNYGIIDIAPINDSLHDRTFRALANKSGFLCASSWQYQEYMPGKDFSNLLYSGVKGELREKAQKVIESPNAHRDLCMQFSEAYDAAFNYPSFFKVLIENAQALKNQMNDASLKHQ